MGSLLRFPLSDEFVNRFPIFIETGYGDGRSLEYASKHKFTHLYSIELYKEAAIAGRHKFYNDLNVDIVYGCSPPRLMDLLRQYTNTPIFFWLDAHFPGGDYYTEPFDAYPDSVRLPLEGELNVIRTYRPDGDYFILIDDLRIYADYDWGDGVIPDHLRGGIPKERNLSFLNRFYDTHLVNIDLRDSGYAMIGQHNEPFLEFKG